MLCLDLEQNSLLMNYEITKIPQSNILECLKVLAIYILRYWENLYKFDSKSDKELFLKYSFHGKAYIVYNLQTQTIMKSINVVIDDNLKEYVKKNLN
jgi:hypothetical protein